MIAMYFKLFGSRVFLFSFLFMMSAFLDSALEIPTRILLRASVYFPSFMYGLESFSKELALESVSQIAASLDVSIRNFLSFIAISN